MPAQRDHGRLRAGARRAGAVSAIVAALACSGTSLAATALSPPVIHEVFTLLPCPAHPVSTLDLEGCAEQRIVRSDRQIDALARAIFERLHDDAARLRFIAAQSAWLAFRQADCASVSDRYEGGTQAAVVAADCTAQRSAERLSQLRSFLRALTA
jgi:uncharacterized protein YecT (DUF1311 family)